MGFNPSRFFKKVDWISSYHMGYHRLKRCPKC
jgi:hypothetical protein